MKRLLSCITIIFIALSACKKDGIVYGGDYSKSYQAWRDFKKANGDSYSYQVSTSSWIGIGSETTFTIKQGKITERSFVRKAYLTSGPSVVLEWKEDENQLGTHPEGATLMTMDEVYAKARDEWLLKRDNAHTYFEAKNDGMISLCGYVPNGCQDDCFNGITIKFIRGL
jgi:hypothetical protein